MNIQKSQNYLNRTFNGWGSYQTAMVEKSKAIGRYALAGCADIARECQDKFTKIDNISPHHYLYIDDKTYGAISRYSYGRSMCKFRLWKTFPEILSNIEAFLNKENLKFDKAEAFKKKISPILLLKEYAGIKHGWYGNIDVLKDKLVSDIGLSRFDSKLPKKVHRSLNRVNRFLNLNRLFLDVCEHNGELSFEIRNLQFEKIFETSTRISDMPVLSKIPLLSKNSIQCVKKIEKFLTNLHRNKN